MSVKHEHDKQSAITSDGIIGMKNHRSLDYYNQSKYLEYSDQIIQMIHILYHENLQNTLPDSGQSLRLCSDNCFR